MSVKVSYEVAGLGKVDIHFYRAIRDFVDRTANFCEAKMLEYAPVGRGKLKESIRQRRIEELKVIVEVGVPYGIYVERGTRPHIIRPVRAKALRFEIGGQVVFAKFVRHPGTKPQFFVRRAQEETSREIPRLWSESWRLG